MFDSVFVRAFMIQLTRQRLPDIHNDGDPAPTCSLAFPLTQGEPC